jgi:glutamate carboxypeptidase
MDQDPAGLASVAALLAPRVLDEARALIALSTPSGEHAATEQAISLCCEFLPERAELERLTCATAGCADDLLATVRGTGERRMLLLGHLDTVFSHADHRPPVLEGERLYGSGSIDMKGGVAVALAVARACAELPDSFGELSVLLVCDEEWRAVPFAHTDRFTGYDACLCFEAGEVSETGEDGVIVRRKGAATLRVHATGRAAHSGAAPENGRNALLALAHAAISTAQAAEPDGDDQLTVVPTVIRAGGASNVVPAAGELVIDARAANTAAFERVLAAVPDVVGGATLEPVLERVWPAMDSQVAAEPLLQAAGLRLGRAIVPRARGGASDASHFAPMIPLTIDGLGPRGAGAHTPTEYLNTKSLPDRIAVALAVAGAAMLSP